MSVLDRDPEITSLGFVFSDLSAHVSATQISMCGAVVPVFLPFCYVQIFERSETAAVSLPQGP